MGTVATEVAMSGQLTGPSWVVDSIRTLLEAPTRRWMRSQIHDPATCDLREADPEVRTRLQAAVDVE
jgi:hypothetical protein